MVIATAGSNLMLTFFASVARHPEAKVQRGSGCLMHLSDK